MYFASWTGDLQGLTPLIAVLLTAMGVWYFRGEIKRLVGRLTKIEASRKNTTVSATMSQQGTDESVGASGSPAREDEEPEEPETEVVAPSPLEEDAANLRGRMIRMYMDGEKEKGDELFDRLTAVETDPVERRRSELVRRASGFIGGIDADGLAVLETKVDDPELGYLVYRMIGACLSAGEKQGEAADAFKKSTELSKAFDEKVTSASLRSAALQKMGAYDQAVDELVRLLADAPADRAIRESIWSALADAYQACGATELYAGSLHQVALLAGNSASKWFQAGYAYSEVGKSHLVILVIHCYITCLSFNSEHQYAQNNLGVVLREHDMPSVGMEYYEQAAQLGNTLAMGNMAQNYLSTGFAKDAEKLLEEAEKRPNPDEKVARVRTEIASRRSDEDEKLSKLRAAGSRVGQFIARYVSARGESRNRLSSRWTLHNIEVVAEMVGNGFVATWSEGRLQGGRRFQGTRAGATITGAFEAESSSFVSDQISWKNDGYGYGIISSDGKKIEFVKLTEEKATYLQLLASSGDT